MLILEVKNEEKGYSTVEIVLNSVNSIPNKMTPNITKKIPN